jgi:hypothetical protein
MEKLSFLIWRTVGKFLTYKDIMRILLVNKRIKEKIEGEIEDFFCIKPYYVYFEIQEGNIVTLNLKDFTSHVMEMPNQVFLSGSASIVVNECVFFSGGNDRALQIYSNQCFKYELLNSKMISLAGMQVKKGNHKLVQLNAGVLFSIGGRIKNKCLKLCEKYNILENKWSKAPCLTIRRESCSACSFNSYLLFAFGGIRQEKIINTIEKLDRTQHELKNWEQISLKLNLKIRETRNVLKVFNAGAIQICRDSILLFGGCRGGNSISDSLIFYPYLNQISSYPKMAVGGSFYQREVIFVKKNKIAAMDRFSTNVHMFNIDKECWRMKKI